MKLFHTDLFVLPLPDGHRFPMQRYRLLRERLEQSRLFAEDRMCIPPAATDEQLRLVHTDDWVERVSSGRLTDVEQRRIGFPWSPEMAERSRRSTGATIAAATCALTDGVAANLAGGTHHSFPDRGAGYCVFNDVAVAIRCLQQQGAIHRALVIDLDVHQGDGTAQIFADDPAVFTVSVHAAKNFPARKKPSDLDIGLPDGAEDAAYLAALAETLERAGSVAPDIIFYNAGVDVHRDDRLGRLALTDDGVSARDGCVMDWARRLGAPVVGVLGGGYGDDPSVIAARHVSLFEQAAKLA